MNIHTSFGLPAKTYIHQICADTGCRLEDLPSALTDKNDERESKESVLTVCDDDDGDEAELFSSLILVVLVYSVKEKVTPYE